MTTIVQPPRGLTGWIGPIGLSALLMMATDSSAQRGSPILAFDGRHVYLGEGVRGDYGAIENQIRRLEQASSPGFGYYVVVVRSAGPEGPSTTRDYADDLYRIWMNQSAARGLTLDGPRSIIVVVAIDNHQVAVHPGADVSALGLKGDVIEREAVGPSHFIEKARAGQYPEAVAALLDRIDGWIAAHDTTAHRTLTAEKAATPAQARPGVAVLPPAPQEPEWGRGTAIGLGLSLVLIAAAALGGLWLSHRRTRSRLDQGIKAARSRATDVMDHLDALKERLKLLPSSAPFTKDPMAGETAAVFAKVQEAVGRLWDRWLQLMDAIDRAQRLARGVSSPFKRKALQDAEAMLDQKAAFAEIDAGAKAAAADLDRLDHAHEAARGLEQKIAEAKARFDAQLEVIRKVGLPVAAYQSRWQAIRDHADEWAEKVAADPIGAAAKLEDDRAQADTLLAEMGRVAGLLQEAQKVAAALEALKREVAEHRTRGLRLDEEGGHPDEAMATADQARSGAVSALQEARPEDAAKELETARSTVEQARGLVDQVKAARDYCRREQPERLRATERLRTALPHAEAEFHRLEREFAPGSWENVRRNLDQVHDLLESFDRTAAEAGAEASDDTQRYLAAAARLRQLAQQQQAALRLMSGIGDRLNALAAVRDECRRRRGELETASRRVEGFFRQNDQSVSTMALEILDQARRGRDAVLSAFDQPRPDWPSVQDGLVKAIEGFRVAQDQAEVDVRSHRQLAEEYERARAELERLADLLSGRREDRKAANQRFRSAAEVLDQIGVDLAQPHGEWPRMLDQVRGAVADIEQAERLAREDIRLAGQAQSEIDEAARFIDQARGSLATGIVADTSAAEAALGRAQQLLDAQHYEQAIESAGQAQQAARRAHQDAAQQASWQQMQADADRRRWDGGSALQDALTTGAAVAAGVVLGNVIENAARASTPEPSVPDPPTIPEPPASDTSVSSWESDTGQSSW